MSVILSPTQELVVAHSEGSLLVVAGPGAGKTRVLTERIRRLLAEDAGHFRVLALTFTNKAANEMIDRLADVPTIRERAFVGTMHSFCLEVLANRGSAVGLTGLPVIFESIDDRRQALGDAVQADPLLAQILKDAGGPKEQKALLGRWLGMISDHKMALRVPRAVEDDVERQVYEAYNAALAASVAVDFDDILLLTYRVFEETPKIAKFYRRQYKYICIDEAQDLNEAQYRILCALCGDEHRNVLVVGDPKQAIYGYSGADPKYLELFVRDFAAKTLNLNDNFRSAKSVVEVAQALNSNYAVQGQLPIRGEVVCHEAANEAEEAAFVLDTIESLRQKGHRDVEGSVTLERCAVLGRNRFVFGVVEAELKARGWQYHKKLSAGSYDPTSRTIQEFGLALRIIANPHDRLHTAALAKCWGVEASANEILRALPGDTRTGLAVLRGLSAKALQGEGGHVMAAVEALETEADRFLLRQALDVLESRSVSLEDQSRAEIIQDILVWREHWDQFVRATTGGDRNVKLFLSHFALGTTEQANREGLALLTVHSAKGMEFDVVFLIGLCAGVFPDYRASSGAAIAEEDRNAFVAVTRSRRLLFGSYPRVKVMPWGDTKRQQASKYYLLICNAGQSRK